ncbi:MAG: hypothetical protein R3C56_28620 [Pirellulaceae bacterium]
MRFFAGREGYSWRVRLGELAESLSYGDFLKLAARPLANGTGEIHRSLSKAAFVKALQRLIPRSNLATCDHAALASEHALAPDGTMIDDFLWVAQGRMIHVCNAPSPAATAASKSAGKLASA